MWLTLLGRFWPYIAIAVLSLAVYVQTHRLHATQAEYAVFQLQVKTLGEQAERDAKLKEEGYAKNIRIAVNGRTDALKRLRDQSAAGRPVSLAPAVAAGSLAVCFSPEGFAAAVEQYRRSVRNLVTEGDAAGIDGKALIEAWPTK